MKTPQELNELARAVDTVAKHSKTWSDSWHNTLTEAAHELRHMAQLRADLHEAAELLRETKPRQRYDKNWDEWKARRDSFLAKISTVAPETKTTT